MEGLGCWFPAAMRKGKRLLHGGYSVASNVRAPVHEDQRMCGDPWGPETYNQGIASSLGASRSLRVDAAGAYGTDPGKGSCAIAAGPGSTLQDSLGLQSTITRKFA